MRNFSITLAYLLLNIFALTSSKEFTVNPNGAISSEEPDFFLATTWAPLNGVGRAELYLAAVGAGKLGEDSYPLIPVAQLIKTGEFQYGKILVRGAEATADIPPSDICTIGENALISLSSVVRKLSRKYTKDITVSAEINSIQDLVRTPADERALLTLLILREGTRTSSPLIPYIMTFLLSAHEHIPSAWDHTSADGAARRAGLVNVDGGAALIMAADALRKAIAKDYNELAPRAIEKLPRLLGLTGPDIVDVTKLYTFQNFAEIWLAIRSRSIENNGYGALVPILCLMNHPGEGEVSNVNIGINSNGNMVLKAKRYIKRGEQLTLSYGDLSAERALLVYGFPMSVWSKLPSLKGFES